MMSVDVTGSDVWHALALVLVVVSSVFVVINVLWRFEHTSRRTARVLRAYYVVLAAASLVVLVVILTLPWPMGERVLAALVVMMVGQAVSLCISSWHWPQVVEAATTQPADLEGGQNAAAH